MFPLTCINRLFLKFLNIRTKQEETKESSETFGKNLRILYLSFQLYLSARTVCRSGHLLLNLTGPCELFCSISSSLNICLSTNLRDDIPSLLQGGDYDAICIRSKHPTRPFFPILRPSLLFQPFFLYFLTSSGHKNLIKEADD